jgi:lipopolysaccharide transport system ATP-binding protein
MKYAVETYSLNKKYKILKEKPQDTFRDYVYSLPSSFSFRKKRDAYREFWALKNISLQVEKGSVLGIIGKNGAGKSTLLKILSRIVSPSTGSATIRGKVSSILEVGTGFHPELTGRENIYLNGAILGMKRREIDKKFDKIVEFSEISKFLDTPVKRYSSGMQVRLAFSVVTTLDSDVLLIDEVLAVGDLSFRKKSLEKMRRITNNQGRTVIFVSHSMAAIDSLCNKVALLDKGKLVAHGKTGDIISEYITDYVPEEKLPKISKVKSRAGSGKFRFKDFWIENERGKKTKIINTGDQCKFVFTYICPSRQSQNNVDLGFDIRTDTDQKLFLHYTSYTGQELKTCPPKGKIIFKFNKFPLAKGVYKMGIRATVEGKEADYLPRAININVENGDYYLTGLPVTQAHSPVYVDGKWEATTP